MILPDYCTQAYRQNRRSNMVFGPESGESGMSVDEGTHGVRELEAEIDGLARYLLAPHQREGVLCYVNRMVVEFGCDHTLRWAVTWRAVRAPQATKLLTRLRSRAGYCDCGIFTN